MANSDILRGADFVGALNLDGNQAVRIRSAARAMGISEQEAMRMIARAEKKINRGAKSNTPIDKIFDQFIKKGNAVGAVNAELPADIDEYRSIPNKEVEFGEFGNQDELQNFGGRDDQGNIGNVEQQIKEREQAAGKKDPNVLTRSFFEKGKEGVQREEMYIPDGMPVPARFVEAAKNRDFGIYQEGVNAPAAQVQRIERDALQQGVDQFGADAFPGAVDVIGRIDDDIKGGTEAEQSLVREMVMRDRQRQNSEVVEANNWRAQAAANVIGQNFVEGGTGARADQALENIGHIAKIGHAKIGNDFNVSNNPVDRGTAIPDSLPLNLPDQYNAPVTDNRYAGPLQKQEQWLVDAIPGYREQGAFGAYGDVSINEQISLARAAIQNAKVKGKSVDLGGAQIRGLSDLQSAANQVIDLGQKVGQPFFNNVDGKNVFNPNPGIGEVLERGGMNARQAGDVAKAMFALEAARRNPINQRAKEVYAAGESVNLDRPVEFGGFHPALGGGEAKIAMLNREKVEGREVKGQLQKLDGRRGNPGEPLNQQELAQARMPFQAGVAGEGVKRAAFVRGGDVGLSPDAIYDKYGPVNGQIANAVIQRYEQSQGSNPDGFGQRVERQRNMDPSPSFDVGPDPWSQPVGTGNGITQERERRMSKDMLNTLASLNSGPTQGPRTPGIRQKIMNSIKRAPSNFRAAPRNQRIGAVAGGAIIGAMGLDGLIGGERDNREQEQYQ